MSLTCILCGEAIESLRASYGDCREPICWQCWCEVQDEMNEDYYGIAPHVHDVSRTGSVIGSTVPLELPEPNENGWIDCSFMGPSWVGTWFRPDNECPGMGVYTHDDMVARGAVVLT